MNNLYLALRLARRSLAVGDTRVLFLAVFIATSAVAAVTFLADRVERMMNLNAASLLGADLVIAADHPLPPRFAEQAAKMGLTAAHTLTFRTVVRADSGILLVEAKAVDQAYPLRGEVETMPAAGRVPGQGTVWLDTNAVRRLGLHPGERLYLGRAKPIYAAAITLEPDRAGGFVSLAPRLMLPLADLPATGLMQEGSRATWRLMLAGKPAAIADFRAYAQPLLGRGEQLKTPADGPPEAGRILDQGKRYLALASLVTVALSAVACALASRRYVARHLDGSAIMLCLGARRRQVFFLHGAEVAILGLAATLAGSLAGLVIQEGLRRLLEPLLPLPLPPPGPAPFLWSTLTGLTLLLGFVLPQLLAVAEVPPLRVLRRDLAPPLRRLASHGIGLACFAFLATVLVGDATLTAYALGGLVATVGAAWLASRLAIVLLLRLPASRRRGGIAANALRNLSRHGGAWLAAVFTLAFTALLLLTDTRQGLLDSWRNTLPAHAPNRFIIDIQPSQAAQVEAFLGRRVQPAPVLRPMVRGRLAEVDGRPLTADSYPEERARRLVEREFNLSWSAEPPAKNELIAGHWWKDDAEGEASVEEGLAKTLGLKLGSRLRFLVAGEPVDATVTSLRKVDWDSFRVNFFVILPPQALEGHPATWISSFYLAPGREGVLQELLQDFPNLTVIDVSAILATLNALADRATLAVEFTFLFTLGAAIATLAAAIQAGVAERSRETALFRVLGAGNRRIFALLAGEFLALGALAGGLAGVASQGIGMALARQAFDLHLAPNLWLPLAAALAGALLVAASGLAASRPVLRSPPARLLNGGY